MVNIEIDGKKIQAQDGAMVIEAADAAGITIPRFCYHEKLSIAANCRMCLVEVEKVAKPLPACATPVTEGMKVHTRSPKALSAQQAVMEFLLINHPLDCPICDQGGECDLQEMAMGYGRDFSRFAEAKRVVADKYIGPLIATDMTRCIHCTRCVRFGQEVAGVMELGAPGRGEHMRITTYLEHSVDSELSGNVIDLCPVGALTSKPYRHTARPWELKACESVSPHDCVGANLMLHTRDGKTMRAVPRENDAVNEVWLSDRDRFSYVGLAHPERLLRPRIKKDGNWQEVDWDTALTFAAEGLKRARERHGPKKMGALGAPWSTTEELYLLQRLMRGIGCGNIDHRLRQIDFRDQEELPVFPWLGRSIRDLENLDAVLVVGSDLRGEQPLLNHRLRKAVLNNDALAMVVNPVDFDFRFPVAEKCIVSPSEMISELAAIGRAVVELSGESAPEGFNTFSAGVKVSETHKAIARSLYEAEHASVLVGNLAAHHPAQADVRVLAGLISRLTGARLGILSESGNGAGAALAGALPHREAGGRMASVIGGHWQNMLRDDLKAYLFLGFEPERDCIDGAALQDAAEQAEFVVVLTAFQSDAMARCADVLLPISLFAETSGTFVNTEGRWQTFSGCAVSPGEARPAWKILRVLGNLLEVEGFEYMSSEEVYNELRAQCESVRASDRIPWHCPEMLPAGPQNLSRIVRYPLYSVDPLVRRSAPLQASHAGGPIAASVHPETAEGLGLADVESVTVKQGTYEVNLPLILDERIAPHCVLVPAGDPAGMGIGVGSDTVSLERTSEE